MRVGSIEQQRRKLGLLYGVTRWIYCFISSISTKTWPHLAIRYVQPQAQSLIFGSKNTAGVSKYLISSSSLSCFIVLAANRSEEEKFASYETRVLQIIPFCWSFAPSFLPSQERLQHALQPVRDVAEEAAEGDGLGDGGQIDVDDGGQRLDVERVREVGQEPRGLRSRGRSSLANGNGITGQNVFMLRQGTQ